MVAPTKIEFPYLGPKAEITFRQKPLNEGSQVWMAWLLVVDVVRARAFIVLQVIARLERGNALTN